MNAHKIIAACLLGLAAVTIPTGASGAQSAPTSCLLTVQPFDDISRKLVVEYADGRTQTLLTVQDNRTTLGGPRTFEVDADVTRINWAWNRQAGEWRVSLAVGPGCAMEAYPYWTHGEHQPSLSMTVGQVPTTTTVAPTTTTAPPATTSTTAPPPTSTTAAPATTTTAPQPLTAQRWTPIPVECADDACQPQLTPTPARRLPETGRNTWPQVRLTLALVALGVAALQLARVMQQDDEIEAEEGK